MNTIIKYQLRLISGIIFHSFNVNKEPNCLGKLSSECINNSYQSHMPVNNFLPFHKLSFGGRQSNVSKSNVSC